MSSTDGGSSYCHVCGTRLPPGATFCPRCGTAVYTPSGAQQPTQGPAAPPPQQPPPPYYDRRSYRDYRREQRRREKGEKNEKGEKGEKGEKSGGGTLVGPIIGGAILVWLGISFYLQQINYLTGNWWAFFLVGLGVIIMFQGFLLYSRMHRPIIGPFIGGGILVVIGLSFFYSSFANIWPLILVIIGIAVVASAFMARRRTPSPTT